MKLTPESIIIDPNAPEPREPCPPPDGPTPPPGWPDHMDPDVEALWEQELERRAEALEERYER